MVSNWRFKPKLTLLYTALFLMVFVPTIALVQAAVVSGVTRSVERELEASGAVFDRLIALRGSQLEEMATVLAGDFGFRSAVATQDMPTMESALFNLVDRVGASRGLVVDLDANILVATDGSAGEAFVYANSISDRAILSSAGELAGSPHIFVVAPVRAPVLMGWIVLAVELDERATTELEALSALPLDARITLGGGGFSALNPGGVMLTGAGEGAVYTYRVPVPVVEGSLPISLVLSHSRQTAFQPYRQMLMGIIVLGLIGVCLLVGGSWFLSDRVTRPLVVLTRAVAKLKQGRSATVDMAAGDEFGDLADGFNKMSREIASREAAITHMATHDTETDLPNRLKLEEELRADRAADVSAGQALLGVRVKRFANVRAAIGYDLAAKFLSCLADRMSDEHGASFRLTADTLAIVREVKPGKSLADTMEDLRKLLGETVQVDGVSVDVNIAVGAFDLTGMDDGERALQCLELVLDHAINEGLETLAYDPARMPDPAENLTLMGDMRAAMASDELKLHYQPKVDTRTGRICEVEALLRWTHAERGFVPPDLFVEMAEETGHIVALTEWVFERALRDQRAWSERGLDIAMGVNMSGRLLASRTFADYAIKALERHGADAGKVVLEITETAVIDNPDMALEQLHRLRDAGFTLSIDDYGTGLSSLSYLRELPVHELKIDKSFVLELASEEADRVLVRSTTELGHSLGLKVTAEGVEDAESFALLQLYGCDSAQGYFISKAIPADAFELFAAEWNGQEGAGARLRAG